MLGNQILIGTFMILVSVVFHITALVYLVKTLERINTSTQATDENFRIIFFLSAATLFVVAVHVIEAWGWAAMYYMLGEFTEFNQSLYFSVVTVTTLGYGDITLSDRWQLLASFEAMGGLILFGVTVAFLFEILRPLFAKTST